MVNRQVLQVVICSLLNLAIFGGCSTTYHPPDSGGVPNRQLVEDQELKRALSRASDLLGSNQSDTREFQSILGRVSKHFPTLPVMVDGKDEPWTRIQLNSAGAGFDAIRVLHH